MPADLALIRARASSRSANIFPCSRWLCYLPLSRSIATARMVLFALTAAVTAIALIMLTYDLFFPGIWLATFARAQAINCVGIGIIIASAACVRTIERYESRRAHPQRSVQVLLWTFIACSAALAFCGAAIILATTREVLIATGCGIIALIYMMIIRRFALPPSGIVGIAVPAFTIAHFAVSRHLAERSTSVLLAFAEGSPPLFIAPSQRALTMRQLLVRSRTFAALVFSIAKETTRRQTRWPRPRRQHSRSNWESRCSG